MTKLNYIKIAKKASSIQISELRKVNKIFNKTFIRAIDLISNCKGKVIAFAGVGIPLKYGNFSSIKLNLARRKAAPSVILKPNNASGAKVNTTDI